MTVASPASTSRSRVSGLRAPCGHGPVERADDEVLLPADAPEVARRVGAPAPVLVALVVARPHVGQRLLAVEGDAAGGRRCRGPSACRGPGVGKYTFTPSITSTSSWNPAKSTWT